MSMYVRSAIYEKMGRGVIESVPELKHLWKVPIGFMASDKKKKKGNLMVYGECIKVNDLWKVDNPHEFEIVVYETNTEHFTEEQYKILLEHELLHVGVEFDEDNSEIKKTFINEHDFTDFRQIASKYGVDWDKPGGSNDT